MPFAGLEVTKKEDCFVRLQSIVAFVGILKVMLLFYLIAPDFNISTSTAKNYIDKMIEKVSIILALIFFKFFKKELNNKFNLRCGNFNKAATNIDCSVKKIFVLQAHLETKNFLFLQKMVSIV